jgi:hypothetical protein
MFPFSISIGRKEKDYGHTAKPDYQSKTQAPSGMILPRP